MSETVWMALGTIVVLAATGIGVVLYLAAIKTDVAVIAKHMLHLDESICEFKETAEKDSTEQWRAINKNRDESGNNREKLAALEGRMKAG